MLTRTLAASAALTLATACQPTPPPPPRLPPVAWLVTIRPDCVRAGIGIWRTDPITTPGDYNVRVGTPPATTDGVSIRLARGDTWTIVGASPSVPFRAIFRNAAGQWVTASAVVTTMPTRVCP